MLTMQPHVASHVRERTFERSRGRVSALQLPALVCLLLGARITGLTRQSLWFDESYTLALASCASLRAFIRTFGILTTSEHLQPLYYLFIYIWSRLAGTSDFALRLPSVFFSVASGILVFAFARNLVEGVQPAAHWFPPAAVIAYCFSSYSFYYAQEARPYALLQMLSLAVVYLWNRRTRNGVPGSGGPSFAIACVLATLTSPFGALLVLSLALADLSVEPRRWIRCWRWALGASACAFAVYLVAGRIMMASFVAADVVHIRQPLWMNIAYSLFGTLFGTTLGPSTRLLRGMNKLSMLSDYRATFVLGIFSLAAMIHGAIGQVRQERLTLSPVRLLALAALIYSILLFLIFGTFGHLNVLPRHASALFSIILLLCAACAAPGWSHATELRSRFILGMAGVLLLNLVSVWRYWSDPSYRKDDYRAAAEVLRRQPPSTATFLVSGSMTLLHHYGVAAIDATQIDPSQLTSFLLEHSDPGQTVELVINEYRGYRWDDRAPADRVIRPAFECTSQRGFAYMQLLACRRSTAVLDRAGDPGSLLIGEASYAR